MPRSPEPSTEHETLLDELVNAVQVAALMTSDLERTASQSPYSQEIRRLRRALERAVSATRRLREWARDQRSGPPP